MTVSRRTATGALAQIWHTCCPKTTLSARLNQRLVDPRVVSESIDYIEISCVRNASIAG